MSEVLVEMEFPANCVVCPMRKEKWTHEPREGDFYTIYDCKRNRVSDSYNPRFPAERPPHCPIKLVLPEQHGDLIDRNKLLKDIEMHHVSDGCFQHWVELQDAIVTKDDSMPCWADGPDGCEELTYHGMAESLRHCVKRNGTDCRYDCQYVERDTGACLHEYLMSDAADYLDKAAATIKKMKKANIVIAATERSET